MLSDEQILQVSQSLDCKNGSFGLTQNNLLMCLNIIKGVKGKLAISLFNRILQNIHFIRPNAVTEEDDGKKKGSIWSCPMRMTDIVRDCNIRYIVGDKLEKAMSNYHRYLNDLLLNNVFYRFGRSNYYTYTYEREVFSWGYMSGGVYFIYPKTVKKLLRSQTDLWNLVWNNPKETPVFPGMTLDQFWGDFALFINDILGRLPPNIKGRFRRYDPQEDSHLYLNDMASIVNDMEDFAGLSEYGTFDSKKLPMSIEDRFDELIPAESARGATVFDQIGGGPVRKKQYSIDIGVVASLSKANLLPEDKLQVSKNVNHLLSLLERETKKIKGIDDPYIVIFKNISQEALACRSLFDKLSIMNCLRENFLRGWVKWYIQDYAKKRALVNGHIIIKSLMKTLGRYRQIYLREGKSKSKFSSLFNDIKSKYGVDTPLVDLCSSYGFLLSYHFLLVSFGEDAAKSSFFDMLASIERKDEHIRRSILSGIVRATYSRPVFFGYMNSNHPLLVKIDSVCAKNRCGINDLGIKVVDETDEHNAAFWRKIKHDYEARSRTK